MSNAFVYSPEPHEVPTLESAPLNLSSDDIAIVKALVADSDIAVRAAHVYDRKGYFSTDDFASGSGRSPYGSAQDDIVVQVSIVIPVGFGERDKHAIAGGIYDRVQASVREAKIAAEQARIAQAEAELAAAQERLAALGG